MTTQRAVTLAILAALLMYNLVDAIRTHNRNTTGKGVAVTGSYALNVYAKHVEYCATCDHARMLCQYGAALWRSFVIIDLNESQHKALRPRNYQEGGELP